MALILWDATLETGHSGIDEQHRSLAEILNRLHMAMKQGKGRDEVEGILIFLKDYTASHFEMEERLMEQSGYSGAARHRAIHGDLLRQLDDLVERFHLSAGALTLNFMDALEDWLVRHIQDEDRRLADELKA